MTAARSVAIVGGGLAGLATATALAERGLRVELFEAKRHLGGRAGWFVDPASGELIDHCQHVAMGCCTEFLQFIRRTGVETMFRRDNVLHFFSPEGNRSDFAASRWLPAPLHLAPAMARLNYLSWGEKFSIARALLSLKSHRESESATSPSIGQWLRERGQSPRAIARFWQVVLVSALGEELDRASVAAARKVFVDGFLTSRTGYELYVPQAPLGEIYEHGIARWLRERGVQIHIATPVRVTRSGVRFTDGRAQAFDDIVVATNWRALAQVLPPEEFPELASLHRDVVSLTASPITSLHLWFDRALTPLPHAVLVDRLTQWLFAHRRDEDASRSQFHYQAVISASRSLEDRSRDETLREVLEDLAVVFPESRSTALLRWRMVTQQEAVFSYRPGLDALRPRQRTAIPHLFLAGDYTATGWPSTMESAVRSGNLAAAVVLERSG